MCRSLSQVNICGGCDQRMATLIPLTPIARDRYSRHIYSWTDLCTKLVNNSAALAIHIEYHKKHESPSKQAATFSLQLILFVGWAGLVSTAVV